MQLDERFMNALRYICFFFSSIEFHLLIVTKIALSNYERRNGAKNREQFLVSKEEFNS